MTPVGTVQWEVTFWMLLQHRPELRCTVSLQFTACGWAQKLRASTMPHLHVATCHFTQTVRVGECECVYACVFTKSSERVTLTEMLQQKSAIKQGKHGLKKWRKDGPVCVPTFSLWPESTWPYQTSTHTVQSCLKICPDLTEQPRLQRDANPCDLLLRKPSWTHSFLSSIAEEKTGIAQRTSRTGTVRGFTETSSSLSYPCHAGTPATKAALKRFSLSTRHVYELKSILKKQRLDLEVKTSQIRL